MSDGARTELVERLRSQDWIDDPTLGWTTSHEFESGSLVWPSVSWTDVLPKRRFSNEHRDVWTFDFVRSSGTPTVVPVGVVFDKTAEDQRARVYFNKSHFGLSEPRRPLIAPEDAAIPPDLAAYVAAMATGERARIESVVDTRATFQTPSGQVIDGQQFIDAFSSPPEVGAPGVPLLVCTVTADGPSYAVEFISWRRPPHGGLSVYTFAAGRLIDAAVYEGPVRR